MKKISESANPESHLRQDGEFKGLPLCLKFIPTPTNTVWKWFAKLKKPVLVDRKRKRGTLGAHQQKALVSLLMLKGIGFHLGLEDWKKSLCKIASTTNAKNHLQPFKDANAEVAMKGILSFQELD